MPLRGPNLGPQRGRIASSNTAAASQSRGTTTQPNGPYRRPVASDVMPIATPTTDTYAIPNGTGPTSGIGTRCKSTPKSADHGTCTRNHVVRAATRPIQNSHAILPGALTPRTLPRTKLGAARPSHLRDSILGRECHESRRFAQAGQCPSTHCPTRLARGGRWHTGQKNDERFMKACRRIGAPQRGQGRPSWP